MEWVKWRESCAYKLHDVEHLILTVSAATAIFICKKKKKNKWKHVFSVLFSFLLRAVLNWAFGVINAYSTYIFISAKIFCLLISLSIVQCACTAAVLHTNIFLYVAFSQHSCALCAQHMKSIMFSKKSIFLLQVFFLHSLSTSRRIFASKNSTERKTTYINGFCVCVCAALMFQNNKNHLTYISINVKWIAVSLSAMTFACSFLVGYIDANSIMKKFF